MLTELSIENLAIIDHLRITLADGFTVLTGETGAGKSIIIDAVDSLLGSRADSDMIRSGADGARIEGVFQVPSTLWQRLLPTLQEYGLEGDEGVLILAREINLNGRNVCRVNGRATTLAALREISQHLVDIHGQGENQSLLRVRQHVHFLDRYANLRELRAQFAELVRGLQATRQTLRNLQRDDREAARRADLLSYQIDEIDAAKLDPEEEAELLKERTRLANAEKLIRLASSAYSALTGGDEEAPSAIDALNEAVGQIYELEQVDQSLKPTREMAEEAIALLEEIGATLRDYREELEYDPDRLEQVEERLELIRSLQRKYGDSVEQVLAYQARAIAELDDITHHEERIEALREQETAWLNQIGQLGQTLSERRREAARKLEAEIVGVLQDLRMSDARFMVAITWEADKRGAHVGGERYAFDATGLDQVEFLIAPNLGEEPKPLATTASGGETSRLMLAMKSVLTAADEIPTLIFDEIDAGIGGRIGSVVGEKLWGLAQAHQVLCVTHLPQMAAYGDQHYQITKVIREGRTVTAVKPLTMPERMQELAMMLGGQASKTTLRNAQEMLLGTEKAKKRAD